MMSVDRLAQVGAAPALAGSGATEAGSAARGMMDTIGQRIGAWSAEIFGTATPSSGSFAPDAGELARRGDVYDLRPLVSEVASRFGAGPAAEGALLRATEDFTRAAALHIFGGDRAGAVTSALENATAQDGGFDGVIGHLEAATRELRAAAGQ